VKSDAHVFYNKEFVKAAFELENFSQFADFIIEWVKTKEHNPTEFTQDLPAIIEFGLEYREEIL
jgi:hypothetical protein